MIARLTQDGRPIIVGLMHLKYAIPMKEGTKLYLTEGKSVTVDQTSEEVYDAFYTMPKFKRDDD